MPQDGKEKQDCEIEAAKRWIEKYKSFYAKLGVTILGDDLYSRSPFIWLLIEAGFHFILTCKESSHPALYQWLRDLEEVGELKKVKKKTTKGKKVIEIEYSYARKVLLYEEAEKPIELNWCGVVEKVNGKKTYENGGCIPKV